MSNLNIEQHSHLKKLTKDSDPEVCEDARAALHEFESLG